MLAPVMKLRRTVEEVALSQRIDVLLSVLLWPSGRLRDLLVGHSGEVPLGPADPRVAPQLDQREGPVCADKPPEPAGFVMPREANLYPDVHPLLPPSSLERPVEAHLAGAAQLDVASASGLSRALLMEPPPARFERRIPGAAAHGGRSNRAHPEVALSPARLVSSRSSGPLASRRVVGVLPPHLRGRFSNGLHAHRQFGMLLHLLAGPDRLDEPGHLSSEALELLVELALDVRVGLFGGLQVETDLRESRRRSASSSGVSVTACWSSSGPVRSSVSSPAPLFFPLRLAIVIPPIRNAHRVIAAAVVLPQNPSPLAIGLSWTNDHSARSAVS